MRSSLAQPPRSPAPPFSRASDDRLARRASRGDRGALEAIFERYQHELYRFCLALLGRPDDAQDALQNAMVKVLRALPGEEREIALRPWLYKIARNEAIELRRSEHETQALDGHLLDNRADVSEQVEQREHLGRLLGDLEELPERQRSVLLMRELSGLTFAEIGAALGTTSAVVRQSIYEARRNLERMDAGRGLRCDSVAKVLSDADGRITRRRDIRAHLRGCADCRRFEETIRHRKQVLTSIAPLPVGIAAGIASIVGGAGTGGGVGAAAGVGTVNTLGMAGVLKAVATVAAVAVLGTAVEQSPPTHRTAPDADPPSPAARPSPPQVERDRPALPAGRSTPVQTAPDRGGSQPREDHSPPSVKRRAPVVAAAVPGSGTGVDTGRDGHAASPTWSGPAGSDPSVEGEPSVTEKSADDSGQAPTEAQSPKPGKARTEHPQHPVHPEQSNKLPKAEVPAPPVSAPAESTPSPSASPSTPPAEPGNGNGLAKGHEKKSGQN